MKFIFFLIFFFALNLQAHDCSFALSSLKNREDVVRVLREDPRIISTKPIFSFNTFAPTDRTMNGIKEEIVPEYLSFVDHLTKNSNVLDIGSGGRAVLMGELHRIYGANTWGVDIYEGLSIFDEMKPRLINNSIADDSILSLAKAKVKNGEYDLILSCYSIFTNMYWDFERNYFALINMFKLLKTGGEIRIAAPYREGVLKLLEFPPFKGNYEILDNIKSIDDLDIAGYIGIRKTGVIPQDF